MIIHYKDYTTRRTLQIELHKGELIEFEGAMWQFTDVWDTMCRLTPINGNKALKMCIKYESLFKN
jgi:hypothetical protein